MQLLRGLLGVVTNLAIYVLLSRKRGAIRARVVVAGLAVQLALAPFAWKLGVEWNDAALVGSLLGTKVVANEFLSYLDLQGMIQRKERCPHSIVVATFALCGFANFGSIGVVLGGLGHLAPTRRADLARLAIPALITGTLTTCLTAAIAGMFA